MKITTFGRGNIGGGLGGFWERAGHQVTKLGHEGGDVSDADVILLAIPGGAVGEALDKLRGLEGKTVIDATNRVGVKPPAGFPSNAEYVKSKSNGPTAKAFNVNFARMFPKLGSTRVRPSNLWCGDDEIQDVVEQLTRDAGYEPIRAGGLEMAGPMEEMIQVIFGVSGLMGPFVYRIASPEEL